MAEWKPPGPANKNISVATCHEAEVSQLLLLLPNKKYISVANYRHCHLSTFLRLSSPCPILQIVCAVGCELFYLRVEGDAIKVAGSLEMPHEVACLDITSWPSDAGDAKVVENLSILKRGRKEEENGRRDRKSRKKMKRDKKRKREQEEEEIEADIGGTRRWKKRT